MLCYFLYGLSDTDNVIDEKACVSNNNWYCHIHQAILSVYTTTQLLFIIFSLVFCAVQGFSVH